MDIVKTCRAPRCENNASIDRTLCAKHAQRWFKYKSFNLPMRIPKEAWSRRICRVDECIALTTESNKKGTLCEIHRYNKRRYGAWEKPIKIELPKNIVHICRLYGELKEDKVSFNRKSPKGKVYLRCKECRRKQSNKRLNDIYITTPKKHEKVKVPSFVTDENKSHAYTVLHRFKLTAEVYYSMLEIQNHVCAICKQPEAQIKRKSNKIKMLSVDHCHSSGRVRGLLCMKCNTALGSFKDSIDLLNSAILYLSSHVGADVYVDR